MDFRDQELFDKLTAVKVSRELAREIVYSLQDRDSWNTEAYAALRHVVEFLIGEELA
jgi:hypothetical protein